MRRAALACLLASLCACVTARPPGADHERLEVTPHGNDWDARLGEKPISQAALFRASGFDPVADEIDDHHSYAWGGLAAGFGFSALTTVFFVTDSKFGDVFRWFTATWALTGFIVAAARFSAPPPPPSEALAAADSHNARLDLAKLGLPVVPPAAKDTPAERRDDDVWQLKFHTDPDPLERAHLGVAGFAAKGRLTRLKLDPKGLARDVDALFGEAKPSGPEAWARATFAYDQKLPEAPQRFEATVVDADSAVKYARFALDHRDRALLSSVAKKLPAYAAGNAVVLVAQGDVQNALGDFPAARASYKDAVAAAPTDMVALRSYGKSLVEAGKTADAVALWIAAIPKMPRDSERFELLDLVSDADRTWLHAHGDQLAAGLLPAYREYQDEKRQERRLAKCLNACAGIQWNSLYDACRADCYATVGP